MPATPTARSPRPVPAARRSASLAARLALLAVLLGLLPLAAGAAEDGTPAPAAGETWRVATRIIPPFVMERDGRLTGFSVELWRAIAEELGIRTTFVVADTLPGLFDAVAQGKADLGIAAVSITAERERRFDFSVTMFDAGLQIAVRADSGSAWDAALDALWSLVSAPQFLAALGVVACLTLVVTLVVWLVERRDEDGMTGGRSLVAGLGHALWWTVSSLAAQAEEMPRTGLGRFVAVVWLFACIAFVTWFTAGLTTIMTIDRLRSDIAGPQDLPGKPVGTIAHSTAATYLAAHMASPVEFTTLEEAGAALDRGRVAAIVYDAPAVRYYAARQGRDRIRLVGPTFRREAYGILFPPNDARRKSVNRALLALRENGRYEEIYGRWFGVDPAEAR